MSHLPEPLLSHNEESMTEHRKSHPPETSLSSQKLAERIRETLSRANVADEDRITLDEAQAINCALIEAWVRVREAEARLDESTIWRSILITSSNFPEQASSEFKTRATQLKAALATARKQLEEKAP